MKDESQKKHLQVLKIIYESAMLNGPFAVLAAFSGGMFSLTDNTKLRPMTAATQDGYTYFASELSALYEMQEDLRQVITPRAGEPVVALFHKSSALSEGVVA